MFTQTARLRCHAEVCLCKWETCAELKRGCSGWEGRGPRGAWCPARWPSGGNLWSCQPCRWLEPNSTGTCSHFWCRKRGSVSLTHELWLINIVVITVLINECLLADFVVKVCNALVGPVFPQCGQNVTQSIWPRDKHGTCECRVFLTIIIWNNKKVLTVHSLVTIHCSYSGISVFNLSCKGRKYGHIHMNDIPGDSSIYVWDNYLVVPVPEVDGALTAAGSLVLSGHTEHHIVWTILQLEGHLCVGGRERKRERETMR